jgi:predicted anti-sigma-YlaC factor YlaD
MMTCRTARHWLLKSADLPVGQGRQERLDAHLADCPACRAYQSRLAIVRDSLAEAPAVEPLPYFQERLRARIDERLKLETSAPWLRWCVRAVPISLLLIGLFVGAIVFLSPAVDEEISQPEALLFQNANPLNETITLFNDRTENKSLHIIFAVNEASPSRRYGP